MDSDNEQCDLETLEALLEEDDNENECLDESQCVNETAPPVNCGISDKSVEDFLNAESDSDDNLGESSGVKETRLSDIDQSELDTLTSLVDGDSDFDETEGAEVSSDMKQADYDHHKGGQDSKISTTSRHETSSSATKDHSISPVTKSSKKQDSSAKRNKSRAYLKDSSDCKASYSKQDKKHSEERKEKCSVSKKERSYTTRKGLEKDGACEEEPKSSTKLEDEDSSPSSTKALREEMLKMQERMLQLQKLLEQQENMQQKGNQHQPEVRKKQPQESIPRNDVKRLSKPVSESRTVTNNRMSSKSSGSAKQKSASSQAKSDVRKNIHVKESGNFTLLPDSDNDMFSGPSKSSPPSQRISQENVTKAPSPKQNTVSKREKMEKDLFGDSDSDWEDMDGEDKKTLSEAGKDLQRLLHSGQIKREAHQPKFSISENRVGTTHSWARCPSEVGVSSQTKKDREAASVKEKQDKNSLQCRSSSTEQSKPSSATADEKFVTEDYSKIRVINPLISSSLMKLRMEGRKMISVSRIHLKLKTPDLQGDWVTIAVIVSKSDSKSSSSGKPYSIWKLNDLEDLENSVTFFLFGEVHKHLWKTEVGTVVGVLNPSIMDSTDKNGEPAFTIKNASQVMIMGRSKDLGWCISKTKAGNSCTKFINKKYGEFCAYHVQAAYRKVASSRLELHGSIAGVKPKSFEKKIFSKDTAYMYGGHTYVPNTSSKPKKGVTLTKLQESMSTGRHNKVNTLSIHDVKPATMNGKKSGKVGADPNDTFVDLITTPSPGSMNLVAFLKNKEKKGKLSESPSLAKGKGSAVSVQSITPKELIKQHQEKMKMKLAEKRRASDSLLASSETPKRMQSLSGKSVSQQGSGDSQSPVSDPLKQIPKLGKGFYSGQDVSLDVRRPSASSADKSKLKAILTLKEKGGIKKEDPNAVKKTDKDLGKIQKRVHSDADNSSSSEEPTSSSRPSTSAEAPARKKSKLLGNVDLNSDEVKSILKARSKHKGALAEAEAEREEVYFNELEKKEMLEEKMKSVTSIEVTVISCKQCAYTAQSAKETCKQEGHTLVRSKTKKRFFVCKKCKHRTYTVGGKFPTEACRKCGTHSFEKTSMYKEREGPKLESEVLNIRGDEIKYLSSMDQKVFLNTVIDK